VSVLSEQVTAFAACKCLDHCNVDVAGDSSTTATDLANSLRSEIGEFTKSLRPLFDQWLSVN
jgi:hypothetical protein